MLINASIPETAAKEKNIGRCWISTLIDSLFNLVPESSKTAVIATTKIAKTKISHMIQNFSGYKLIEKVNLAFYLLQQ